MNTNIRADGTAKLTAYTAPFLGGSRTPYAYYLGNETRPLTGPLEFCPGAITHHTGSNPGNTHVWWLLRGRWERWDRRDETEWYPVPDPPL